MNKKKMIVDKYDTVYSFDMYVVLNPKKAEWDKRFEWLCDHSSIYDEANIKLSAYSCIGVIDKSNGRQCFVVIINELGVDELFDINTISHEAFHITMDLLNTCRLPYSDDSCEAYAYLLGYLTECIYKTAKKAWISLRWALYYIMLISYLYSILINLVQNLVNISLYMEFQWI